MDIFRSDDLDWNLTLYFYRTRPGISDVKIVLQETSENFKPGTLFFKNFFLRKSFTFLYYFSYSSNILTQIFIFTSPFYTFFIIMLVQCQVFTCFTNEILPPVRVLHSSFVDIKSKYS